MILARLALAAATAALYAAALPPFDHAWLGWLVVVPLVLAVRDLRPATAGAIGAAAGFLSAWSVTWWLAQAVSGYFAAGIASGALAMSAAYVLACSTTFGLFAAGLVAMRPRLGTAWPLGAAAWWTAMELLRARVLLDPWGLLGYTQAGVLPVVQLARVTGVYGLSFLLVLVGVAIAEAAVACRRGDVRGAGATLLVPAGVVAAVVGAGCIRLGRAADAGVPLPVAVVQGNVEPAFHWTRPFADALLARHVALTRDGAHGADLVVWPENTLALYVDGEPAVAERLSRLARETGADVVVGGPRFDAGRTYNSAYLVRADGRRAGHYDKQRPVWFAEAPPFGAPAAAGANESPRSFSAGTRPGVLRGSAALGVTICHEILYPDLVAAEVLDGATVLVNIANDGWLDGGYGVASAQHFAMARVRAVEMGRPLVRAATTGVSGVVDATGRLVAAQPRGTAGVVRATVLPATGLTPYARFGDLFALLCALGSAGVLLQRERRRGAAPLGAPVPVAH